MVWWILLGGLVLGVLLLGLAVAPVLRRLGPLRRALAGLQGRMAQAQQLRTGAEVLQQRVAAVAEHAAQVQTRVPTRHPLSSRGSSR